MEEKKDIHNQSWNRAIVKYGKWYLLSSFLTKGIAVILTPIYTRVLTQADYGILQSLNAIIAFLPLLLSCCLDSAYGRFYHECKYDEEKNRRLFSTIYWFILIYGGLLLILIFLTSSLWMEKLLSVPTFPYAYLAFIPTLFNQLALIGRTHLEQSLDTKNITFLDVISTIINGGVSVFLLLVPHLGIISRLIGIACGTLYLFFYYTYFSRKHRLLAFCIDKTVLKDCLKFSVPLMPAMMGSWLGTVSDRLIIAAYVNMETVGLYSFAAQLSSLIYISGDAITRILGPLTMSGLVSDREGVAKKIADFSVITWGVMLFADLFLFLFSKEIVAIMGTNAYNEAYISIPILGFCYVIGMQQRFPIQIVSYYKQTWIISMGCILMGVVNIVINFIFVPRYGYSAAIVSKVLSNIVYVAWSFLLAMKYEKINYKWGKMSMQLLLFIISVVIAYILIDILPATFLGIAVKCVVCFVMAVIFAWVTDKTRMTKAIAFKFNKDRI